MPKVLCKLLNASDFISGVKFVSHQDGMLSEEISDDAAAAFLEVPGYELALPVKTAAELAADQRAADAEQRAAADEQKRLADIQAKADAEQKSIADEAAAAELAKQTATAPPANTDGSGTPPAGEVKEQTEADAAAVAAQKAADKKAAKQAAAASAAAAKA